MAKKRAKPTTTTRKTKVKRYTSAIANLRLSSPYFAPTRSSVPLSVIQDRRNWTPDPVSLKTARRTARITVQTNKSHLALKTTKLTFVDNKRSLVCIRRKTRREVIFAKNKQGGGHKRPRITKLSEISCKG